MYSSLNSGAPLDSIHSMKNHFRSCPRTCSATLRKSSVIALFQAYCCANCFSVAKNFSSPIT